MTRQTVAILGLGAMGSRIATNLMAAGYGVIVWNRTAGAAEALAKQGATVVDTPRQAAAATVVISMVTDNEASRAVWLEPGTGAVFGLGKDSIAIEASTLTLDWVTTLASAVEQQGARFLDAPVVGSRPQAEAKRLIFLIGGEVATLDQVRPILEATSAAIHHLGAMGHGTAMKLAVNSLFGVQVAALAEMLSFLSQLGLSPTAAMDCLGELPITSLAMKGAGRLMMAEDHQPLFPINLVDKDFRYTLTTAQAMHVETPTTQAVQQVYQAAIAAGYGQDNITGVIQHYSVGQIAQGIQ